MLIPVRLKLTPMPLPLAGGRIPAGFPSPADDYIEERLDLAEHLVKNPDATFYVRVAGNSMNGLHIQDGDLLVVDRSLDARDGDIVVAIIDGEFTVKQFHKDRSGQPWLLPANPDYQPIKVTEESDNQIWGVVTSSCHSFR